MEKPKEKTGAVHAGHRQRMKRRFLKTGLDDFQPHEVLELLLFYAIPQKDTNALAHRLLHKFGSLSAVIDAPLEELEAVEGIGESAAVFLKLLPQLLRRYEQDLKNSTKRLCGYEAIGEYLTARFVGRKTEVVVLLLMDSKGKILFCDVVNEGTALTANIYIKEIVTLDVRYGAVTAVLAHNHPSGECTPSRQDIETTQWVFAALENVEVRLLDHVIVSGQDYLSLAQVGLLPELFGA